MERTVQSRVIRWLCCVALLTEGCGSGTSLPELPERQRLPILSAIDRAYEDVQAEPRNAEVNGRLATILHLQGDVANALVLYRRAFALDPRSFRWAYLAAVIQLALEPGDAGTVALRHALSLRRDPYPAGLLRLARARLRMGDLEETASLAGRLEALGPMAAAWAAWLQGRIATLQNSHQSAANHFRRACEIFPAFGAAHWHWGRSAAQLQDAPAAQEHFRLADRHKFLAPPLPDPLTLEAAPGRVWAEDQIRHGYEAELRGDAGQAARLYREALSLDPAADEAHARLIAVLRSLGEAEAAIRHYHEALRLNPQQDDAYAAYGTLLVDQLRFQEARAAFDSALQINPYHPEALNALGELLEQNGQPAEAEPHYRQAIASRPDFREAHLNLGRILVAGHRYDEAFRAFAAVTSVNDAKTPALLYEMVSPYLRAGRRPQALNLLRRAHELAGRYGQVQLLDRIEKDRKVF